MQTQRTNVQPLYLTASEVLISKTKHKLGNFAETTEGCEKISAIFMIFLIGPSISGVGRPIVVPLKALTEL